MKLISPHTPRLRLMDSHIHQNQLYPVYAGVTLSVIDGPQCTELLRGLSCTRQRFLYEPALVWRAILCRRDNMSNSGRKDCSLMLF
jgi:hypothetical protein